VNPTELLWPGTEVYHRRFEKSGVALIAVQRALSADPGIVVGADKFLKLYEWISRVDAEVFTRVWSDPVAYFWVRRAVHFLAACRGEPMGTVERAYCAQIGADSPDEALRIHLSDFKRFVVALAVICGKDVAFDEPYEASLPLSIPGTRFVLVGDKRTTIRGVSDGAIEVMGPRRLLKVSDNRHDPGRGVRIESCPVLTIGDAHVFLNPATFNVRGIGFPTEWTALPLEFQSQHAQAAADALAVIRRLQPATFAHLAAALHTIALKPPDDNFANVSASELPGAFVCTVPPSEPYALASYFVHEFYHNTLFCIEEAGPFFEATEDDEIEGENHYSPWVEPLRPLHGIMHAVYVFLPVFRFWSAVLRDGTADEGQLAYTRESIARIPMQLRIGINQLRRHAQFTAFGATIFQQMAREVEEIEAEARALGADLKTPVMGIDASGTFRPFVREGDTRPMTAGEMLLEHLEKSDLNGECAEEKAHLLRALA
jgi:HEXXH motif-containing protein